MGKRSIDDVQRKLRKFALEQREYCARAVKIACDMGNDPVQAALDADIDRDIELEGANHDNS